MIASHRRPLVVVGALAAGLVVRSWYSRRLARRVNGEAPGVLTDDGVLLHTETDGRGPQERPTVVLVHGFCSSMREYDAQRSVLADSYRLVLYDQRGHGRTGWGDRRHATIERLGKDLGHVLDQATTGQAPVVLVAHSLGGMAVMALAEPRPDLFGGKVVAVALLSSSAGRLMSRLVPGLLWRAMSAVRAERALTWLLWAVAPLAEAVHPFQTRLGRRLLLSALFGPGEVPTWAASRMVSLWAGTSQSIAASFYPAMVHHDRAQALPTLGRVPTLVLTGTDDVTIPARHSRRIAAEIGPSAELMEVPAAGHMVDTVDELLEDGAASHPFVGIVPSAVTPQIAETLDVSAGVLVLEATEGGPAARAGLRRGDVITSLEGRDVETVEDFLGGLRGLDPGDTVEITFVRAGEEQTATIELDRFQP